MIFSSFIPVVLSILSSGADYANYLVTLHSDSAAFILVCSFLPMFLSYIPTLEFILTVQLCFYGFHYSGIV